MWETKFHARTKWDKIVASVYTFTQIMGKQKILNWKVARILEM